MTLVSARQMPHRQMAGKETPTDNAADAAPPRNECPVYLTPGGGWTWRAARREASQLPTSVGTGGAPSPGICHNAAGAGLPADRHASARTARKRCSNACGQRPWRDASRGHGAVKVAGEMRGRFLASSLKWIPAASTTSRPASAFDPVSPRAKNVYVTTTAVAARNTRGSLVAMPCIMMSYTMEAGKPTLWSGAPCRSASSSPKPLRASLTRSPTAGLGKPASWWAWLMLVRYCWRLTWCTLSSSCNQPRYASTTATRAGNGHAAGTPAAGRTTVQ
mmetsp:Transcript_15967/g.38864  ORF Transcript_15967/g.38864 Transcript_15967/m.38864 type:complete len:276 (+) Transcript_15967:259-1086(+)